MERVGGLLWSASLRWEMMELIAGTRNDAGVGDGLLGVGVVWRVRWRAVVWETRIPCIVSLGSWWIFRNSIGVGMHASSDNTGFTWFGATMCPMVRGIICHPIPWLWNWFRLQHIYTGAICRHRPAMSWFYHTWRGDSCQRISAIGSRAWFYTRYMCGNVVVWCAVIHRTFNVIVVGTCWGYRRVVHGELVSQRGSGQGSSCGIMMRNLWKVEVGRSVRFTLWTLWLIAPLPSSSKQKWQLRYYHILSANLQQI